MWCLFLCLVTFYIFDLFSRTTRTNLTILGTKAFYGMGFLIVKIKDKMQKKDNHETVKIRCVF